MKRWIWSASPVTVAKKRYPGGYLSLKLSRTYQPRQEPGRNFGGTVVPVPPQVQPNRAELLPAVNVAAVAAADSGVRVTNLLSTDVLMLCTVAMTTPLPSVVIAFTYFVPVPALISQPQPLMPGAEPPDWYTSVI